MRWDVTVVQPGKLKRGAMFGNPCFVQIHPTCIPVHGDQQSKLTLMSESLRNDGRVWVPKKIEDAKKLQAGTLNPNDIPDEDRDFYLERRYPGIWYPVTSLHVLLKKDAMPDSESTIQVKPYSWTLNMLSHN